MKNSKVKLSFILIIVLGAIVGFSVVSFLSSAKTDIYVFKGNYSSGTKITEDKLAVQKIDSSVVEAVANSRDSESDAFYITGDNLEKILNTYLQADVLKGMPLMSNLSSEVGGSPSEKRISDNTVAVTVPADSVTCGNPYIKAGSRVNVYAGYQLENNTNQELVLLQNIKVVDVIVDKVSDTESATPEVKGVTLEVNANDANALNFAAEFGKIRLGVVKPGHYKEVQVPAYSMQSIVTNQTPAPAK